MKKLVSLCLALIMLFSLVACGESSTPPADTTPDATTETVSDTLKIAYASEPPSFNVYEVSLLVATTMYKAMFNGLTKINNTTLQPECDLAESYSVENDIEWTFNLRKGVKFHDGSDLTSADVVASLEYARSLPATTLYTSSFDTIEAIDEYTVKIVTHEPYAGLLSDLAYQYNFIFPEEVLNGDHDLNTDPVGTGPYKLKEWNYGNYIALEANENYYNKEHMPQIKNLVFNIIPEGSSRTMALQAGDIDLVWDVPNSEIANLQTNSNITVESIDSIDNVIMFFNNNKEPWNDENLRKAIASAINREEIIAAALNGYGSINYSIITDGYAESSHKDEVKYDLNQAQAYLDAWGGDPSSVKLTILCSTDARVAIATCIQNSLKQIGIEVEPISTDAASQSSRWKSGDFDAVIGSWSPADALSYVIRFHSDRAKTYAGVYTTPELDEMVLDIKSTLDNDARKEKIENIVSHCNQRCFQVSLYQSQWFRAYNANLTNVVMSKTGYADWEDMTWAK